MDFLTLLADIRIQREDAATRNEGIYKAISKMMAQYCYTRTYKQCWDKLKKLKSDYNAFKDHNRWTGSNTMTCYNSAHFASTILSTERGNKSHSGKSLTPEKNREEESRVRLHFSTQSGYFLCILGLCEHRKGGGQGGRQGNLRVCTLSD